MKLDLVDIQAIKLAQADVRAAALESDLVIMRLSLKYGADLTGAQIANDGTVALAPLNPPERPPLPSTDDEP